ncbi:hypothetical protein SAMN02982929_00742 [Saccharopolyspora kobensis]|uniref:Allophanate hydrolase C-terminal domain-containing protein n=1 Tax=Saccharopolyspora kobensis TaxID=146035 RepID=A0A1H5V211_9PSEU|nr:hypothetical protein [Saccharopolyspora kobensis]SEF81492.1 hypothetical protein SAMN02982929_00742 [Saccharopolyspora kobensis]SFC66176.1 hypothetical protein SAMN05216506_1011329 [Saccharopolyspora kobensis]
MVHLFVNGGALRGGGAHRYIEGCPFVGELRTAPHYRFVCVRNRFPALWPVSHGGAPIWGEVYDVPLDRLRDQFLPNESPELELGVIELEDGTSSLAMLLRRTERLPGKYEDITGYGGWRNYRDEVPPTSGKPSGRDGGR